MVLWSNTSGANSGAGVKDPQRASAGRRLEPGNRLLRNLRIR